ncbi:MAG: helix-turn-helix domain containing protein [Pseudonocardiales bacterium]|nr:helix-turn-helix domain containing protein [Pseudonocardiales bacterium]
MSRARVAVLKVISKELTVTAAAVQYGYSRQHLHRLLARYRDGGLDAVDPRTRRPQSNPRAVGPQVRELIITTRQQLTRQGLDAGPVTLAWYLQRAGLPVASTSTIRRIFHSPGWSPRPHDAAHLPLDR